MPRSFISRESARRRRRSCQLRQCRFGRSWQLRPRRGLTLIEMLMATAITLLMMAAVVTLFANLSGSIRNRRAVIELSSQIRQVRQRLVADLAGCTVPVTEAGLVPWQRVGEGIGYFEIFEGRRSDLDPSQLVDGNTNNGEIDYTTSLVPSAGDPKVLMQRQRDNGLVMPDNAVTNGGALGDWDDILALTVRSDEPFRAEVNGNIVESNLAEVIWFAIEDENGREPGMRAVYRRVLLIAPWVGVIEEDDRDEISAHRDPQTQRWVANTLADLTKREYRYEHEFDANDVDLDFPHEFDDDIRDDDEDLLMLTDALAFDIRVYDPGAPLFEYAGVIVQPGDPGWDLAVESDPPPGGYGAYVDLGWDHSGDYQPQNDTRIPQPLFQQERQAGWHPRNPTGAFFGGEAVYDTWSWHYENDGVDQYLDNLIDLGTNGLDDDGINGVDDVGERETSPPYNLPLRGVKVVLRVYERDARQVRESSVTHSFVP